MDFLHSIYEWFRKYQRDLPWRKETDPYKIWISEIILQQTRVEQGIPYYQRFTEKFPAVSDLASAEEDEVLKIWQGLGYYSRARYLHAAARSICNEHKGEFPKTYEKILALKGTGPYTAAAVSSIAFGLPYPAVDGNVYRVLARYYGINFPANSASGKKIFEQAAADLMNFTNPGFHNQALMEFGALKCLPKTPLCKQCPVAQTCHAYTHNEVPQLPLKIKKTRQQKRFFIYYHLESGGYTWIEKRTGNDIWKNLYQFPLIETTNDLNDEKITVMSPEFLNGYKYTVLSISAYLKHMLTHQIIFARLVQLKTGNNIKLPENFIRIPSNEFYKFAVPVLLTKLLRKTDYL